MEEKDLSIGPFVIFNLFPRLTDLGHRSQIMEGLVLRAFSYTLKLKHIHVLAKYLFKLPTIAYLGYLCLKYHTYCALHDLIRWYSQVPKFPSSIFCNKPIWWPIGQRIKKIEPMEAPPNSKVLLWSMKFLFLWTSYVARMEDNICHSIWDKSEVLWRTLWGEHVRNLGTLWLALTTHWGKKKKEKKKGRPNKDHAMVRILFRAS